MSNSRSGLVGRRSGGPHGRHITMVEVGVLHDSTRRSKIAFWTVGPVLGLATGVVASGFTQVWKAALIGVVAGAVVGFVAAFVLFCWPALRVVWHWLTELVAFAVLLSMYLGLVQTVAPWVAMSLILASLAAPMAVPPVRRFLFAMAWCVVSRHRLRLCFAAFVASQRIGLTPLILWARPVPAGERVWVWLRPGLALADLEARLDKLAAGCWAAECRVTPASRRYAALVRIDIARRNPLGSAVGSPLVTLVPHHRDDTPAVASIVGGLDLPEVPDYELPALMPVTPKPRRKPVTAASEVPPVLLDPAKAVDDRFDWI
jgi:hypothetical protein